MITVIGSLNMDLVVQMNAFPKQGETILGNSFQTVPVAKELIKQLPLLVLVVRWRWLVV